VPAASDLLTPLLGAFMRRHPEIELDLDYNDRFVDVIEDGFDAVIRSGEVSDSRLMQVKLGDFTNRLVAAPAYLARMGEPRTPAELARHRLLHHRFYDTGKLGDWGPGIPEGTALPVALASTSFISLIDLAVGGCGIASLPYFAVADRLRDRSLREILPDAEKKVRAFRLLWPRSKYPLPKVSAFVKFMTASLSTVLEEGGQ
jgi:DNA-binding transcriptional LysR family regulator